MELALSKSWLCIFFEEWINKPLPQPDGQSGITGLSEEFVRSGYPDY